LFFAVEVVGDSLLAFLDFSPFLDGVGLIEVSGGEDKVFVLTEAHLGVLGAGLGGEEGATPVEFFACGAVHEDFEDGFPGGGGGALAFGVDA
jgi:hypothetical protein